MTNGRRIERSIWSWGRVKVPGWILVRRSRSYHRRKGALLIYWLRTSYLGLSWSHLVRIYSRKYQGLVGYCLLLSWRMNPLTRNSGPLSRDRSHLTGLAAGRRRHLEDVDLPSFWHSSHRSLRNMSLSSFPSSLLEMHGVFYCSREGNANLYACCSLPHTGSHQSGSQ